MKLGLTEDQFEFLLNNFIKPTKTLGIKAYCFGSRARGDCQKFSDIDILIMKKNQINEKFVSDINEFFENSNFPFKVDIVFFDDLARSYKENVERDMIELNETV